MEWQPIETAPKDGSPMLLWHVNWQCSVSAYWSTTIDKEYPWIECTKSNRWPIQSFSHWMPPLPPPQTLAPKESPLPG